MDLHNEGVNNLREGIVRRAVEDYISAMCGSKVGQHDPEDVKYEIERFFRSKWFQLLAGDEIDGEACIKVCRERGNYAKWREAHKCNKCSHKKKCVHGINGGNFTAKKECMNEDK